MNYVRICSKCGVRLDESNTGGLKWLQPDCNRCTHSNPTCDHRFHSLFPAVCYLCGFDKNYKEETIH